MTRWADTGRGDHTATLAMRLLTTITGAGVVEAKVIYQSGRPTSLRTTYRAPVGTLEAVTRLLAAQPYNAELTVTPEGDAVTWVISEPLSPPS